MTLATHNPQYITYTANFSRALMDILGQGPREPASGTPIQISVSLDLLAVQLDPELDASNGQGAAQNVRNHDDIDRDGQNSCQLIGSCQPTAGRSRVGILDALIILHPGKEQAAEDLLTGEHSTRVTVCIA